MFPHDLPDAAENSRRTPLRARAVCRISRPLRRPWARSFPAKRGSLSNRHRAKPIVRAQDPRGREVYWVGNAGAGQDAGPGTDFHAVAEGYASVTPLQIDLTRHAALTDLKRWLEIE